MEAAEVNKHGHNPNPTSEEQLCGDCAQEVKEGSKALCCEVCDVWFHIQCQNLPDTIYEFMLESEEGEQLLWCCKHCKRGCVKFHSRLRKFESRLTTVEEKQNNQESEVTLIKGDITEVNNKNSEMNTRVSDLEAQSLRSKDLVDKNCEDNKGILDRLATLEAKVLEQEVKVGPLLEKGTPGVVEQGNTGKDDTNMGSNVIFAEMYERRSRENNMVIHGVAESSTATDQAVVFSLMKACDVVIKEEHILSVGRLGKAVQGREKPRPILVKFSNSEIKKDLFRNLSKLKGKPDYDVVKISHDQTRREREYESSLWKRAKNLEIAGKGKHLVRGPPWNRRVVKATGGGDRLPAQVPRQETQQEGLGV